MISFQLLKAIDDLGRKSELARDGGEVLPEGGARPRGGAIPGHPLLTPSAVRRMMQDDRDRPHGAKRMWTHVSLCSPRYVPYST